MFPCYLYSMRLIRLTAMYSYDEPPPCEHVMIMPKLCCSPPQMTNQTPSHDQCFSWINHSIAHRSMSDIPTQPFLLYTHCVWPNSAESGSKQPVSSITFLLVGGHSKAIGTHETLQIPGELLCGCADPI